MQANDRLEVSTNVGPALERNRVFAAEGGHEDAMVFPAATVTRDVERLRSARSIPERVAVSGHVYDVVSGSVETAAPAHQTRQTEETD
jgi:carbonic anhydrase